MSNTDNKLEAPAVVSATKLERWALFAEIAGAIAVVMKTLLALWSSARATLRLSIKLVGRVAATIFSCSLMVGSTCIISTLMSPFHLSFGTAQMRTLSTRFEKTLGFRVFGPNGKSHLMSRFARM